MKRSTMKRDILFVGEVQLGVCIPPLDTADYSHEEGYVTLRQIPILQYTFCNINKKHGKDLSKSMAQQGFQYKNGMMNVFFRADGNPLGATVTSIFEEDDGGKVVKCWCFLIISDRRLRHRTFKMLKKADFCE